MSKYELTLSYDSFNKPMIKKDADADALRVVRCLMKKKDNPLMGNIEFNLSQYRFEDIDELDTGLAAKISNHIARVLPMINISEIRIYKVNKNTLGISMHISGETERSRKKYYVEMSQGKDMTVNLDSIITT